MESHLITRSHAQVGLKERVRDWILLLKVSAPLELGSSHNSVRSLALFETYRRRLVGSDLARSKGNLL